MKQAQFPRKMTCLSFFIFLIFYSAYADTYRVKPDGSDSGDGSNWGESALSNKKFAEVLLNAREGDVFLLAAGTYIPYYDENGKIPLNGRYKTFTINSGVTVIGGYDESGNKPVNSYNQQTTLSGDINAAGIITGNVYHVVTVKSNANNVRLTDLTISGGYGNGGGNYSRGAGVFMGDNTGTQSQPVILTGVHLTKNSSDGNGCGIFIGSNGVVEISESRIENNTRIGTASVWGGGISIGNNAVVKLSDSQISDNTAKYGGGVHITQARFESHNNLYSSNSSGLYGGAINAYSTSTLELNNDSILYNTSVYGGGIHNEAGTIVNAMAVVLKGNKASAEGGGFINRADCTATLYNCVIEGNSAVKGAGLDNRGVIDITQTRVINNNATGSGGGINQNGKNMLVRQSEISGNSSLHGGGFHMEGGKAIVSNTTISGNTATDYGGGIKSYVGSLNLVYVTVTGNTAANNRGSGMYVTTRPGVYNSILSGNTHNDDIRGTLNTSGTNPALNNIIGSYFFPAGNSTSHSTDVGFLASVHFEPLAFNRDAFTRTHKLFWQTNAGENPAVGRALSPDAALDASYLKDQTNKKRGNKPSLGAYDEDLLKAYDDVTFTEMNNTVDIEISGNDAFPESCTPVYTLRYDISPALLYGQFSTLNGTTVSYTPNANARGTDTLYYDLKCGDLTDVARVIVTTGDYDRPDNIKDEEICMEDMRPIKFSVKEKYANTDVRLDGFSMALVGDLNGDGKPEVVALGLGRTGVYTTGDDLSARVWYVHIFNGQTGERIHSVNLGTEPSSGALANVTNLGHGGITSYYDELADQFQLRYEPRHNSPSHLALADLDSDGVGEIVVVECGSLGNVYALKPTLDNEKNITGFTKMWHGNHNGADYSFKAPYQRAASLFASNQETFGSAMPYISDLNGDGIPEVIVYNKVFNGKTGALILELETLNLFGRPISQANVNTYTNNQNPNGGGYAYVGRRPGTAMKDDAIPSMTIIDIDNDGIMEIVAGSKVYKPNIVPGSNSTTGNTFTIIHGPQSVTYPKANGSGYNTFYLSDGYTAVADIDGDGHLDIIVQTSATDYYDIYYAPLIYVWDPRNPGEVKAVVSYLASSLTGTVSMPFIGDINGRYDDFTGTKKLPEICFNSGVIYDNTLNGSPLSYHPQSAADINANKRFNIPPTITPDGICGHAVGFTYHANPDGTTPVHERLKMSWVMEHGDESAHTGITMFDFDADGVEEIVYRDETSLRVISPARKTYIPKNEPVDPINGAIRFKRTDLRSYTGFEAPVIADINGDGSADIITLANTSSKFVSYGYMFVFEADSESWAPARPVWNQGMYYPLQINDDLTVPRRPISTLTKFVSQRPDQPFADTIQPFNANWVQQPVVRTGNYVPVLFTPDLSLDAMVMTKILPNPESTVIKLTIQNRGKNSGNSNTPITFYHTSLQPENKIITVPLGLDIYAGEIKELEYTLPGNLAGNIVYARLVDDGSNFLATGYYDCDPDNNVLYTFMVIANDDRFLIMDNNLIKFDILANDTAFCKPVPEIVQGPKHGIAEITADDLLSYTTLTNYAGLDSVRYLLRCEYADVAMTDTATVYLLISKKPDKYISCPGETVTLGFAAVNDVVYTWYDSAAGGNAVTIGETYTVTKDYTPVQTWYIEPVWNGVVFPRYQLDLFLSDYCGLEQTSGCSETGTLLFREDFGGNEITDPLYKPEGIPEMNSTYEYNITPSSANYNNAPYIGGGQYMITKIGEPHNRTTPNGTWFEAFDHTHPDTGEKGYFLQVNSANEQGQFYSCRIDDLCAGSKLFFSAWINNVLVSPTFAHHVNQVFILEDLDGNRIAEYYTGDILNGNVGWKQYGFEFTIPAGITSVVLRIMNNGKGSSGNDFGLDDIEIYLCTPEIELNVNDTVVCEGTDFEIKAYYEEDCTFGNELTYRWEYRATDGDTWKTLKQENVTVDCNNYPANMLNTAWEINPVNVDNEGYYRILVSSLGNIDKANCRAASDIIQLSITENPKMPDIRVQSCSGMGNINLSRFVDTVGVKKLSWKKVVGPDIDETTGIINSDELSIPHTYIYKYIVENQCYTNESNFYLKTLKDTSFLLPPDTIVVCYKDAEALQLNKILGLEAGSVIEAENTVINSDYTTTLSLPSIYYGASFFNGKAFFENGDLAGPQYDYSGPLSTGYAKKATFNYIPSATSCLAGDKYSFVIIITEDIVN